jgi:hypothetical protein
VLGALEVKGGRVGVELGEREGDGGGFDGAVGRGFAAGLGGAGTTNSYWIGMTASLSSNVTVSVLLRSPASLPGAVIIKSIRNTTPGSSSGW